MTAAQDSQRPAPTWLVSSIANAQHRHQGSALDTSGANFFDTTASIGGDGGSTFERVSSSSSSSSSSLSSSSRCSSPSQSSGFSLSSSKQQRGAAWLQSAATSPCKGGRRKQHSAFGSVLLSADSFRVVNSVRSARAAASTLPPRNLRAATSGASLYSPPAELSALLLDFKDHWSSAQQWETTTQTAVANQASNLLQGSAALIGVACAQASAAFERAGRWLKTHHLSLRRSNHGGAEAGAAPADSLLTQQQRLMQLADAAEHRSDPRSASEHLKELAELLPPGIPHSETLARLSKQVSDHMYMPGVTREQAQELEKEAIEWADRSIQESPECAPGFIARCVCRGRLALLSDNRTKVQLAKLAADDAVLALSLDPRNDLAHHLIGRWHYEMSQISPFMRYMIKVVLGTQLMQGTLQQSLSHFRTAVEICPQRSIHHVEIGRTLIKMGDTAGAAAALEQSLRLEVEDINAELQQRDAAAMLQKLLRSSGLKVSAETSPPPSLPPTVTVTA